MEFEDLPGYFAGDRLDIAPARLRSNHTRERPFSVEGYGQIEFLFDFLGHFDQNAVNGFGNTCGLVGHETGTQQFLGGMKGFFCRPDQFDSARLSPASRMDLGFYNKRAFSDGMNPLQRKSGAVENRAVRNGKAEPTKNILRLVLVNIHRKKNEARFGGALTAGSDWHIRLIQKTRVTCLRSNEAVIFKLFKYMSRPACHAAQGKNGGKQIDRNSDRI